MQAISRYLKPIHLVGIAILASLWALQHWDPTALETLRLRTFDIYQQIAPREYVKTDRPVVVIDLDDESLERKGQWPWPRTLLAQMVDRLFEYDVDVVGFDVFFPEYDRLHPDSVAENLIGLPDDIAARILELPPGETAFAAAMGNGPVVLGMGPLDYAEAEDKRPPIKANFVPLGESKAAVVNRLWNLRGIVSNVPELEEAADGLGMVAFTPEVDGVVRRVNLAMGSNGRIYPSLTLEMLRTMLTAGNGEKQSIILKNSPKEHAQSVIINPAKVQIPVDSQYRAWVHYRNIAQNDRTFYIPAADVLDGTVSAEHLQNAMALVGTSAAGLKDIRNTPIKQNLPGVEVHAQLLEMILNDSFLSRPAWLKPWETAGVVLIGILMIVLVPLLGAAYTLLLAIAIIGSLIGTSWYAYTEHQMLVDAVYPSLSGLIMYMSLSFMNYMREEAQKKQVRGAFSMYMSPALVEKLADEPELLKLGGEMKEMSLLFCDIRGFTTISETYKENPEDLTRFINKFLTPMTGVILEREGTIDKYMGDCIMAFWNAPLDDEDHATHACDSALAMLNACDAVNSTVREDAEERAAAAEEEIAAAQARLDGGDAGAEADLKAAQQQLRLARKEADITVKIGIGINTDVVCVGNMGSDQRFDYSVLGDGVNLAARLEGQSKTYGTTVVLGENTATDINGLATIELDLIQVKGKFEPERIFGLVGDHALAEDPEFKSFAERHAEMLAAYRGQEWAKAEDLSKECRGLCAPWQIEGLYDLFDERIAQFKDAPPDPDWDGVFIATSK